MTHSLAAFARKVALPVLLGLWTCPTLQASPPPTWGDLDNGRFANPILFADYSDPDLLRVGEDFYLIASDFHFMGIQVLHSKDLVNWRLAGRVFDRLDIDPKYDSMSAYAEGTWAPSLRWHNGRFWLYVCTPHDGLLLWTADKPEGPWKMKLVRRVDRWEDPCPFWDDDGKAYLVHGVYGAGPLMLHRMSDDGLQLLDDGVEIYRGPVAEGPKLFKRHGWYYISLPEGGVDTGGQTVLRSRVITGPYERREVLPPGSPHQGGLVELDNGESWFIGFKSTGAFGRVAHLLPVRWSEDDWPVFGASGQAVQEGVKPGLRPQAAEQPARSDDFSSKTLSPQWQWNHNPLDGAWSLTERPGWLRLHSTPSDNLVTTPNTLTQKIWGPSGRATVSIDGRSLTEGGLAGLALMSGKHFDTLGVLWKDGHLWLARDGRAITMVPSGIVYLRVEYHGDIASLSESLDGMNFKTCGEDVTLRFGQWKGARLALFSHASATGYADFDDFTYDVPCLPSP